MPHLVGGAMGVSLCTSVKRGHTRFDIISLNIHKTTSRWYCMAVVLRPRLLTFACLAWHPANCSTALPKVFSSVYQCANASKLICWPGVKPGRSPCGLHKLWPTLVYTCTHSY